VNEGDLDVVKRVSFLVLAAPTTASKLRVLSAAGVGTGAKNVAVRHSETMLTRSERRIPGCGRKDWQAVRIRKGRKGLECRGGC